MGQISDRIRMADLVRRVDEAEDIEQIRKATREALLRMDAFMQDLILQLNSTPTIFTVDPAAQPEKVEGARTGDIAIFKRNGVIEIEIRD